MKQSIENYVSQITDESVRKPAFFVWSLSALAVFVWISLILLAPLAAANDFQAVANPLYKFFSFLCHQIPGRSFHLETRPFAVCARCFGVYFGLLAGLTAYPIFRSINDLQPLARRWLFAAMIPMAIDFSLGFFNVWANTHWSRFFTGAILGAACAVYVLPALIELAILAVGKTKRLSR